MKLTPINIDEANEYVKRHHRHHGVVRGARFAIAVTHLEKIVGVAIVGRPVARNYQDGWTVEVTRCCTDGTKNACSFLYGAAWRAARALGYRRCVTYILKSELGTSLRAAGWRVIGQTRGGSWSREGRPRIDKHSTQPKICWERVTSPEASDDVVDAGSRDASPAALDDASTADVKTEMSPGDPETGTSPTAASDSGVARDPDDFGSQWGYEAGCDLPATREHPDDRDLLCRGSSVW